jgi:hypothetical protein
MAATRHAKSIVWRLTSSIGTIKRKIGYETEDDDIHEMHKGIVNMVMDVDIGCTR